MKKKFAIMLASALVLSTIPTTVLSASPLASYDLYADTHPDYKTQDVNIEQEMADIDKQLEGMTKALEINKKIRETSRDNTLNDEQKLKKMKGYNNELKTLLSNYKDDPDYDKAKKILDTNDRMFAVIENKNLTPEQKAQQMEKFQDEYLAILQDGNSSASQKSGGERNADLRRSSQKIYANTSTPPAWEKEPQEVYYENPTFEGIKQKYKKGNFTGCMQEAEAYVRKNPDSTLGFYYLAMAYAKSGDKENAIKAYEKVISLHDSPLIVKYATNGRNCVMQTSGANCYPNVNVPDYVYPYAKEATAQNLTPIDPETLVTRNLTKLQSKLVPIDKNKKDENIGTSKNNKDGKEVQTKVKTPFANQDAELDKFINSPYGNGLSPNLNTDMRKQQLKYIKDDINREQNGPGSNFTNYDKIKEFDKNEQ